VRARRHAGIFALTSVLAAAPALAAPIEPAARPPPRPGPKPALQALSRPPRTYRPYVDRGYATPAPYAYGSLGLALNLPAGSPPQAELSLGFGVGLTSRLWLDGSFGTLRWAPSAVFHSAQIGPNLLLLDTPALELDAMLHVSGPSDDGRPVELVEPALYAVIRVEHALRVDTSLAFDASPGPTPVYGIRLPAAFAFQITEHLYASVGTGVTVGSFADPAESTAIPAGLTLGWSDYLHATGPEVVAIVPSIAFPQLLRPWAGEPFRPGVVTAGVTFYYAWKY
jgi:hypothetical protein